MFDWITNEGTLRAMFDWDHQRTGHSEPCSWITNEGTLRTMFDWITGTKGHMIPGAKSSNVWKVVDGNRTRKKLVDKCISQGIMLSNGELSRLWLKCQRVDSYMRPDSRRDCFRNQSRRKRTTWFKHLKQSGTTLHEWM